ncbi:hypothetical protein BP5796_09887 [Coleophoma crateriformis]|uniref:F-box domain-containing protein n=1 Tax=Coleophoma crateriformis TaxID=565419 RepID=A0A3D8QTT6_9HELO|nr:hypothetical protein BP5796_09887 [Coleophoma crateriformis]
MSFSHLPNEVLLHIVRNLSRFSDLCTCSLISHTFLSVARPILYREIEITSAADDFDDEDDGAIMARQAESLKTISENAYIGSLVHKLRCRDTKSTTYSDLIVVEDYLDLQDIVQAAKNMTSSVKSLATAVAATCPMLKSFEIVGGFSDRPDPRLILPKSTYDNSTQYELMTGGLQFPHLEHFGLSNLRFILYESNGNQKIKDLILQLVQSCGQTLISIRIPILFSADRTELAFIMKLSFIRELPPSLEELYIEISAESLLVDEDDDFNPFCSIGEDIFGALKRLHTCDLMAWICDADLTTASYPGKAVHYRRLRHAKGEQYKSLWTSRQDRIYPKDDFVITHSSVEIQGEFEGKDAKNAWLDANEEGELEYSKYIDEPKTRQFKALEDNEARRWPHNQSRHYQDRVKSYEMYEIC